MRAAPRFFWCALAWHLQTTFLLEKFRAAKLVVLLSTCEREWLGNDGGTMTTEMTGIAKGAQ
jgi:hypothetical protein